MAQLAIKGHVTRVKEVIEILEMLGGKNAYNFIGACNVSEFAYSINEQGIIDLSIHYPNSYYTIFTLEEFLEKFPYKVGDKVSSKYLKNYEVSKMEWESANNRVIYKLQGMGWYSADELQPYKEAPMYLNEKTNKQAEEIEKILKPVKEIMEEIKLDIPDGYEFFGIDDDNKVVLTKKQPQYPKTYVECAKILDCFSAAYIDGYKNDLLEKLQELLVCRDAYWKIAGEQMGLSEPWKPDWLNTEQDKYVLYTHDNVICLNRFVLGHNVLAFPTAEMQDDFLENFRDLINETKELL